MSKILDRYAGAVHSSNLSVKETTVYSDSDVLGAAGLAGKRHALAMALTRLMSGDKQATHDTVRVLAELAWGKAHSLDMKLKRTQATDLAKAVEYGRRVRLYPLSQAANPPPTVYVDASGVLFDATIPYDVRFFESLDRVVQIEPWIQRDRAMIDSSSRSESRKASRSPLTRELAQSSMQPP